MGSRSPLAAILSYLAATNILLGIFNLIPGFPLDGGRVLRSIIWKISGSLRTATRAASVLGEVVAFLFILAGIWLFFSGSVISGIWIGFIGWFLLTAAQAEKSQVMLEPLLRSVTVGEIMNPTPVTVPADISLQQLVDDYLLPYGLNSAIVMQGDQFAGLITLGDIRHVPLDQWPVTPVAMVMVPADRLPTASPTQSLDDVLPIMSMQNVDQLPVVQDGRLVGALTRDAILRFIEVRRSLGIEDPSSVPRQRKDRNVV
jgi:CBS domain-containing protein